MSRVAARAILDFPLDVISGPRWARPPLVEQVSAREFNKGQLQRLAVCRGLRTRPRRHSAGRLAFLVLVAVLAAWLGALVGQRAFRAEARFIERRAAVLEGGVVRYGTPEIPGHPGAQTFERRDLLRLFVALDAVD